MTSLPRHVSRAPNRSRARRWSAAVLAVTALAACATGESVQPDVTAAAPTTTDAVQRTITVTALGRATGRPGALALQLGVEVFGDGTGATLQALSSAAESLTDFMRDFGITDDDIQTSSLWASPNYGMPTSAGQPSITGYQASETFTVRIADIESAAVLLDGAAMAVGDAFRLHGLSWTLTDTDPLLAAARRDGVERARRQAGELADATGLTLGEVQTVTGNAIDNPYLSYGPMAEGIPFNAGTQEVYTQVTVTFTAA